MTSAETGAGEGGSARSADRLLRSGLAGLALVIVAGLMLLNLAIWSDSLSGVGLGRDTAHAGLFVAVTAVLIGLAFILGGADYGEGYFATLWGLAPFLPCVAATVVVLTYVATADGSALHHDALAFGASAALSAWVIAGAALRGMAAVNVAQSRSYGQLVERTLALRAGSKAARPGQAVDADGPSPDERASALDQLRAALDVLEPELGLPGPIPSGIRYVSASGYINLWRALHRGEEALILVAATDRAVAEAYYDVRRLSGSAIPDVRTLTLDLRAAIQALDPAAATALIRVDPLPASPVSELSPGIARSVISQVRRYLNDYRDGLWDGLIRERNRLLRTILVTATVAFLLVGLAVIYNDGKAAVAAASVYFLVGAVVGLFAQLRTEGRADSAVDDYGLFEARLLHVPLVSGLAALGGVFLAAVLPSLLGPTAGLDAGAAPPTLDKIFVLTNSRALLAAAVFGLAPELLIHGLRTRADTLKKELASSEAGGSVAGSSAAASETPKEAGPGAPAGGGA
ncbi:MAG: hypothetical protein A2Z32_09765 [Chloroflexi bacterium RBG_16_69_14]|nr:MAG: hypothetical protein A2Z32_09765 [Chloroflexi bacterium RBG_16_69_14]